MKKILVTGAGGFIGFNLCNHLAREGYRVIGVDLHYPEEVSRQHHPRFQAQVGDFRNHSLMKGCLSGVDTVFHLAAIHLQISSDQSAYWDINVHSLGSLLDLAAQNQVRRFVHVSSAGVYGNLEQLPADEETPCRPQSIYGETKLAGEDKVREFSEESGFPVVIIRPAWVYGPYCPRTLKIYKTLRKGRFVMIGDGENLRHPLYIADMIEAFCLAMKVDTAVGELFVVGGQEAITTNELLKAFCRVMNFTPPKIHIPYWLGAAMAWAAESVFGLAKIEPPLSRRTLEFFDTNNAFNITKARRLLGFDPKFTFENGLKDSTDWLERNTK